MINLDKIKNAIGNELFDFIGDLDRSDLEDQLKAINADIEYLNNHAGIHTKTEFLPKRQLEKTFIEYRLEK
jgi:hypothetical protein